MLRTKSILTVLILLFVIASEMASWPILRLWNLYANRGFIDLHSPLRHIECFAQGSDIEILRQNDGPCGGYWYGTTFIYLGKFLHLSANGKYFVVAAILIPLTYLLVTYSQRVYLKLDLIGRFLLIASVFSPPLILLFQRGNLDALIVLMLLLGIKLIEGSQKSVLVGWLVFLLATLFKFWSLPALFVGLLWIKNQVWKFVAFLVAVFVTFIVFREHQSVDFGKAFPSNENVFGARFLSLDLNSTVSYSLNPQISLTIDILVFFIILIICLLLIKNVSKRGLMNDLKQSLDGDKKVWILGSCFIFCYFASSNVDYRLTPLLILVLSVTSKMGSLQNSNLCLLLISTTMWLTYPSGKLQLFGDFFAGLFSCLLLIYFLSQAKTIVRRRFSLV